MTAPALGDSRRSPRVWLYVRAYETFTEDICFEHTFLEAPTLNDAYTRGFYKLPINQALGVALDDYVIEIPQEFPA
jgi:hypothetical protein